MNELSVDWEETSKLLREARKALGPTASAQSGTAAPVGVLTGTLEEFEEFLSHNELELAWDALAAVAERTGAPPAFWRKLACAAARMRLLAKEASAAGRAAPAVSCDRALAIARQDAELAYRELFGFRITIIMEHDGWHIDYYLRDPRLNGGGPHYVIDAESGAIVSKRYEQ